MTDDLEKMLHEWAGKYSNGRYTDSGAVNIEAAAALAANCARIAELEKALADWQKAFPGYAPKT